MTETSFEFRELTTDEVIKGVREIVRERPDYLYENRKSPVADDNRGAENTDPDVIPSCFYVHTTADGDKVPGCVVGHWLNRQGVPLSDLEEYEGNDASYVTERFFPDLTLDASGFLSEIQQKQDNGMTWGEAYRVALESEGLDDPDE